MKSLNNCNVAVCFAGQSRTYEHCAESIKAFFGSERNNVFRFFGHIWDTNSYKIREGANVIHTDNRIDDIHALKQSLNDILSFERLVVEKEYHRAVPWGNMFYSIMRSNLLKQQYEIENNMMFDLVIRARLDVCYRPGETFESLFNLPISEKCLYGSFGHMNPEFFLPNPDDVIYSGSSLTMDLIDSLYNALYSRSFYKLLETHEKNNLAFEHVGPGVLIYKWMTMKNILPVNIHIDRAVKRIQYIDLNYDTEWDESMNICRLLY